MNMFTFSYAVRFMFHDSCLLFFDSYSRPAVRFLACLQGPQRSLERSSEAAQPPAAASAAARAVPALFRLCERQPKIEQGSSGAKQANKQTNKQANKQNTKNKQTHKQTKQTNKNKQTKQQSINKL